MPHLHRRFFIIPSNAYFGAGGTSFLRALCFLGARCAGGDPQPRAYLNRGGADRRLQRLVGPVGRRSEGHVQGVAQRSGVDRLILTKLTTICAVFLCLVSLSELRANPPFDVVVVGEEHGNSVYHRQILESLPELSRIGYRVFSVEQPEDISREADLYIEARRKLDEERENMALWLIFAKLKGLSVPRLVPSNRTPFGANDRVVSSLNLLTEAKCLGFDTQLADLPVRELRNYIHQYRPTGRTDNDREAFSKTLAGVYGTLGARNRHMAEAVGTGTILVVGRAHTGETPQCVEVYLRERGLSVISVDLIGADMSRHETPYENADFAVNPEDITRLGGLAGIVKSAKRDGFCGRTGENSKDDTRSGSILIPAD